MKNIRVNVTVAKVQPGAFLDLYKMLAGAVYNQPNISNGTRPNEIVIVFEGHCDPDAADGYFLETGCSLGLVRGFLVGTGHVIERHSVERIA